MELKTRTIWLIITGLLIILVCGIYFHLIWGTQTISSGQIRQIILAKLLGTEFGVRKSYTVIIWHGRLPRALVAFLVGASLAVAGSVMQAIFKNPMASPGITGASSAAVLGAVVCIAFGIARESILVLPIFAIASSLLVLILVYLLSTSHGRTSTVTLLLVGMACSLFLGSFVTLIITLKLRDWEVGSTIIAWTLGELNDRHWDHVYIVGVTFVLGLFLVLYFAKDLNILMHGEDIAANFGVDVSRARFFFLLASAIITGGAVGVAGLIGFVGLIVPHITRTLIGADNRILVPVCGLIGGVFLLYCDLIIRLTVTVDLRIGTVTGIIGAPYFIYLVVRNRKKYLYY